MTEKIQNPQFSIPPKIDIRIGVNWGKVIMAIITSLAIGLFYTYLKLSTFLGNFLPSIPVVGNIMDSAYSSLFINEEKIEETPTFKEKPKKKKKKKPPVTSSERDLILKMVIGEIQKVIETSPEPEELKKIMISVNSALLKNTTVNPKEDWKHRRKQLQVLFQNGALDNILQRIDSVKLAQAFGLIGFCVNRKSIKSSNKSG